LDSEQNRFTYHFLLLFTHMEKHPLHLKIPKLQTSPEVERAVERQERQTGENVPNDPVERIEAYMDRLENIFLNPDERIRERNIEMFQDKIYDTLIIKRDNFPESYFELQKHIARERGQAVEEIPVDVQEQMKDVAIEDQKVSLDAWIDYLTEEDVAYPTWFKFYVWNQIIKLSQFDKELGKFKSRTESTVARFPDINRAALAKILDIYEKVKIDNKNLKDPEIRENFSKRFPTLYAEFMAGSMASQIENKEEIRGQWIKYEANNPADADKLWQSVEGKTSGAGWCIEGKATAHSYNKQGNFYVYYTYDKDGNPTQPRLAIQMTGSQIGQIRGLLPHQDIEPIFQEVLDEKLKEFGTEADAYRKKSQDMRQLTELGQKQEKGERLTKDDLLFLYEVNSQIESFGYQKDPRIKELRSHRNLREDMPILFDCLPEQIAYTSEEITEKTKAYIGALFPNIFQTSIEHIYTSFPEGKLQKYHIEIGGKTKDQYETELKSKNIVVGSYAQNLLDSPDFITSKTIEGTDLVRLTVGDLGFANGATTEEIYTKAETLGLELCPPEVGPALRLSYLGDDWMLIAMKQIRDRDGDPYVFYLIRYGGGLGLDTYDAGPTLRWGSGDRFVFRLRKKT